jgi:DNA-binding XRE family transcriptional regulator
MNKPQIIKTDAGEDLIVLTQREYDAMRARAGDEEAEDAMTARIIAETADGVSLPLEMWDKIDAARSPIGPLRRWRELTQCVLAEAAGISQSYLSDLEAGKRKGDVDTLRKLAAALQVSLDDVLPDEAA